MAIGSHAGFSHRDAGQLEPAFHRQRHQRHGEHHAAGPDGEPDLQRFSKRADGCGQLTVIGVISDPNYYGIATNTLVVGLPPQSFTAGSVNGQQLTLQLTGTPNYPYILVSATNLTPPVVWQPIFTNYADTNGNWSFTIPDLSGFPAGFYRVGAQ